MKNKSNEVCNSESSSNNKILKSNNPDNENLYSPIWNNKGNLNFNKDNISLNKSNHSCFIARMLNRESVRTPKLTKLENNKQASNLEAKILDGINFKSTLEAELKRNKLTPLNRRSSNFESKQNCLDKEAALESICLSKSFKLTEDHEKTKIRENEMLMCNSRLFLPNTKENPNRFINFNLKKNKKQFKLDKKVDNKLTEDHKKSNNNNLFQGVSDLQSRFAAGKRNKNLNFFYFPDISDIGFPSTTINKSFNNENKNFMLNTSQNSIKFEENNSHLLNIKGATSQGESHDQSLLFKNNRRLSNILQHHLDQSQSINSLNPKERNNSIIIDQASNENYSETQTENVNVKEDVNNENINKVLSNTKLFANENSNNLIRLNRNKLHLNKLNNNQNYFHRSFDFEKNKYKKRYDSENSFIAATAANVNNDNYNNQNKKSKFENNNNNNNNDSNSKNQNLKLNKLNLDAISDLNNGDEPKKPNGFYEINVIGAFSKRIGNEDISNNGFTQIQDMSTTVFDKSEQVSKRDDAGFQTQEFKGLNNIEIVSPNETYENFNNKKDTEIYNTNFKITNKNNNLQEFLINSFDSSGIKSNIITTNNNENNILVSQFNKDSSNEAHSLSIQKSISIVTQNKNLLENSFESNTNSLIISNNVATNILHKKPCKINLNCIEETHFNFVFISQAAKKIMKIEDLSSNNQERFFSTVVEVDEIEFD